MMHHVTENHPEDQVSREPLDPAPLSPREREVLDAAVDGLSARDIARRLSCTEATVRSHLSAIYSKFGVAGRVELLARLNGAGTPRDAKLSADDGPASALTPKQTPGMRSLGAGILVAASVVVVFSLVRPDLPPRSDLTMVSGLLSADHVASLDLRGETLTVVETSGDRLRVERVAPEEFEPIMAEAVAKSVVVTVSSPSDSFGTALGLLATAVLPIVLPVVGVILIVRAVRRPPGQHAAA